MKKYILTIIISALLCSKISANDDFKTPNFRLKKVVIDAGHGGHDTGCHGGFAYEKNVTLSVALKLGALINANFPEVQVIYTRDADFFVELKERANIANRANADLFISVHCNANPSKTPSGTETYFMGLHKAEDNLEVSKRENNVIMLEDNYQNSYDGFDPNSPESQIIFSLYQNAYMEQSAILAQAIEDEYARDGRSSRGVKQAGFLVLWRTAMPSILSETGFLTNSSEEAFMKTDEGQQRIAECLFRGFRTYKEKMENTNSQNTGSIEPSSQNINTMAETKSNVAKSPYTFRVQFLSSSSDESSKYKHLKDFYLENTDNNMYRFLSGNFTELIDAETYLAKMKYDGYKSSYIVAYKNGNRITFTQYKAETANNQ